MVIRSQSGDVFDLPPEDLKRLVQGHIWREEHFNGALMVDIANREDCSDTHIRKAIMSSFDISSARRTQKMALEKKRHVGGEKRCSGIRQNVSDGRAPQHAGLTGLFSHNV